MHALQIPTLVVLLIVNLMMLMQVQQMAQRYGLVIQLKILFCYFLILYHKTSIAYFLYAVVDPAHSSMLHCIIIHLGFFFRYQKIWVLKLS